MTKFNVIQKKRRAQTAERKRKIHGDPKTGKLKQRTQPQSVSGKRKRKLLKKWRRDQKDAIEKGLVTMEDVEMAVAEGMSQETNKTPTKFPMKKSAKIKLKQSKGKGKNQKKKKSSTSASEAAAPVDAMVE